jgi:pre-mRNA-processing factor 19
LIFFTVSGEIPLEPVVANGFLFEKRLITKFIQDSGKCPISNVELSEEDLIAVHGERQQNDHDF